MTLTSDLPEVSTYARNNSNFIDQTPDIIKDIPPEIKNSPPNDTTDESSKEKLPKGFGVKLELGWSQGEIIVGRKSVLRSNKG